MPDRLRYTIIVVVAVVWVTNFAAGFVIDGYEPRESINGIFMAIVGGALAVGSRGKSGTDAS